LLSYAYVYIWIHFFPPTYSSLSRIFYLCGSAP
jgi:hypothetical protein